jgi:hypothetical protein
MHDVHKERGSFIHFHPHFMRKGALHSQRNEFIFSISSSFHEKGCTTSAKKGVHLFIFILISWENMHYMHKETIHFSFSSPFHEKACITSTKKGVHLFIFILISWESVHYMHKETSTSFHSHFLRKCALCAQKNGFDLFIFTFIIRKSTHYMGENVFHGELCILFEPFSIFISKLKWIHLILIFLLVYYCGNSWLYVFSWMYLKHN